jgi:hypothetical protein
VCVTTTVEIEAILGTLGPFSGPRGRAVKPSEGENPVEGSLTAALGPECVRYQLQNLTPSRRLLLLVTVPQYKRPAAAARVARFANGNPPRCHRHIREHKRAERARAAAGDWAWVSNTIYTRVGGSPLRVGEQPFWQVTAQRAARTIALGMAPNVRVPTAKGRAQCSPMAL